MITSEQFNAAVKTIVEYKIQLEKELNLENLIKPFNIDIQKGINVSLFNILRNYYLDEYKIDLRWDDLKYMDSKLLQEINFIKLRKYRGFGRIASFKLEEILTLHSIMRTQ